MRELIKTKLIVEQFELDKRIKKYFSSKKTSFFILIKKDFLIVR